MESFWVRHSVLLSGLVVIAVVALGYLLDHFLIREGMPKFEMMLLTSSITGIVAGSFFFYLIRQQKAQRELMCERMRTIAELNHHIRNALQVIYGAVPGVTPEPRPVQMIKESAHRIEWALRELLPQYPENPNNKVASFPPGYAAIPSRSEQIGAFSDQKAGTH